MSYSKCACHINGYELKDAKARAGVEKNKGDIVKVVESIESYKTEDKEYLIKNYLPLIKNTSKVSKVYAQTHSDDGGYPRLFDVSTGINGKIIPMRDDNGQINVPNTPTKDAHATSKAYVNEEDTKLKSDIKNGSIIAGSATFASRAGNADKATNATNATNATYATYASTDTSKGTIDNRLISLVNLLNSLIVNTGYEEMTAIGVGMTNGQEVIGEGYGFTCEISIPSTSDYGVDYDIKEVVATQPSTAYIESINGNVVKLKGYVSLQGTVHCAISYKRRLKLLTV